MDLSIIYRREHIRKLSFLQILFYIIVRKVNLYLCVCVCVAARLAPLCLLSPLHSISQFTRITLLLSSFAASAHDCNCVTVHMCVSLYVTLMSHPLHLSIFPTPSLHLRHCICSCNLGFEFYSYQNNKVNRIQSTIQHC